MKQQRRYHRAIWLAPMFGAAACWFSSGEPAQSPVTSTPATSQRASQTESSAIVLTGGVEPVVEYVGDAHISPHARSRARRVDSSSTNNRRLPSPHSAAAVVEAVPDAAPAYDPAPAPIADPAPEPPSPVADEAEYAVDPPAEVISEARLPSPNARRRQFTFETPAPAAPTPVASSPAAPSSPAPSPGAPVVEAVIDAPGYGDAPLLVNEPVEAGEAEIEISEPLAIDASAATAAGDTDGVASETAGDSPSVPSLHHPIPPSPSTSTPVVEVVVDAPPAIAGVEPVQTEEPAIVAPDTAAQTASQPLANAPLVASPQNATPVVTPVEGMPEMQPVAPAAEPQVAGQQSTAPAEAPSAAPRDQRWAKLHTPGAPSGGAPLTAYPLAAGHSPLPTISQATPRLPGQGFGPPKIFGELLTRQNPRSPESMTRSRDLEMVAQRADAHTLNGFQLAGRRAFLSAQSEFTIALRLVAEALDVHEGTDRHSRALSEGLRALEESDEFLPTGKGLEDDLNVRLIAQAHRSQVLNAEEAARLRPLEARQRYYTYAQEQLAVAGGSEMAFSMALFGLGKLHAAFAAIPESKVRAAEPKALVLHQAAVMVDSRNALAANELGVLLARYGRYEQARDALLHSARVSPQPTTWQNLAIVHFQLGEQDLGKLAQLEAKTCEEHQRQLAAKRNISLHPQVQWMSPEAFAQTSTNEVGAPSPSSATATTAAQASHVGNSSRSR